MQVEELAEMMVKEFAKVERRFDAVDQRFDGVDRRFEAIDHRFETIDHRFECLESQVAEIKETVSGMYASLDAYARKTDRYFQEHTMLGSQVSRHDRWIGSLAEHAGLQLES